MALSGRALAVTALGFTAACSSASSSPEPPSGTDVQILSLSTWLGQLDPIAGTDSAGVTHQYGGLAALSAYFAADRAAVPSTVLLADGDSFGASPPLASQFADEPAVDALAFLGAGAASLSNHNFNEGPAYLAHLIERSPFPYVASNMTQVAEVVSPKVQAPYTLLDAGSVKVGVVGITSPDAPNRTTPGNFGAITITEPTSAANAAARAARAAGATIVVAMTDLRTNAVAADGTRSGPLIDFAAGLTGVDVVLGSKARDPATSRVGGAVVIEQVWKGRTYGRARVHVDGGAVVSVTADIVSPDAAAVTPDAKAVAFLAPYRARLGVLFDQSVSLASGTFPLGGAERVTEVAIGDLVADAYLAKYAGEGAQIAVMNGAGIRDTLPSSYVPADRSIRRPVSGYASGPPFDLVVGDAYAVLPFGNMCVLRSLTGAVLWQVLEQSVLSDPSPNNGFLQIAGFRFTYKASAPAGVRVQSVTLDDGTAIGRADTRVIQAVDTDFLDQGGDNYGMLVEPAPVSGRDVAAEVLLAYMKSSSPLEPVRKGRITRLP